MPDYATPTPTLLPGLVSTLAGTCGLSGARDGPADEALFSNSMKSLVCLANCSVLVGDVATGRLR